MCHYQLKARHPFRGWLVIVAVGVAGLLPWQLVASESEAIDGPQQELDRKAPAIAGDVSAQQLIAGLRQAEERIHSLGADYALESENYFTRPGAPLPDNIRGLIQDDAVAGLNRGQASFDVLIDGRLATRYSGISTSRQFNGNEYHRTLVVRTVFDGQHCHSLTTTVNAKGDSSRRVRSSDRVSHYSRNPLEFTLDHHQQRISDVLKTHGVEEVVRERLDGQRCFKVTTRPHHREDGYRSKRVYWIDPHRGFLVVRRQSFEPSPDGQGWELHHQVDCQEFVEQSPSVWLPSVVESQTRTTKVVPSYTYSRDIIHISDWRVNEEIGDDVFRPDWETDSDSSL